jgi:hypothetical protein
VEGSCEHGNEPSGSIKCSAQLHEVSLLISSSHVLYVDNKKHEKYEDFAHVHMSLHATSLL